MYCIHVVYVCETQIAFFQTVLATKREILESHLHSQTDMQVMRLGRFCFPTTGKQSGMLSHAVNYTIYSCRIISLLTRVVWLYYTTNRKPTCWILHN